MTRLMLLSSVALMAACSMADEPRSKKAAKTESLDQKIKSNSKISRNFGQVPWGPLEAEKSLFVQLSVVNESSFLLMKKDGSSYIFEYSSSEYTAVSPIAPLKNALKTYTLHDGEAWFITEKGAARSVPKDGKAGSITLSLNLNFPPTGPQVLGIGESWLMLGWDKAAYLINCDGKVLSATKMSLSDQLFSEGVKFGGKTADSLWSWYSDGKKLAIMIPNAATKEQSFSELNLDLQNLNSAPKLMSFAPSFNAENSAIDFEVPLLVMTESGLYFSGATTQAAEEQPGSTPTTTHKPLPTSTVPQVEPTQSPSATPSPSSVPVKLSFATDVAPLNQKYCVPCHGPGSGVGDYSTEAAWKADAANIIRTVSVSAKGTNAVMPTRNFAAQPADAERNIMVNFLRQ